LALHLAKSAPVTIRLATQCFWGIQFGLRSVQAFFAGVVRAVVDVIIVSFLVRWMFPWLGLGLVWVWASGPVPCRSNETSVHGNKKRQCFLRKNLLCQMWESTCSCLINKKPDHWAGSHGTSTGNSAVFASCDCLDLRKTRSFPSPTHARFGF